MYQVGEVIGQHFRISGYAGVVNYRHIYSAQDLETDTSVELEVLEKTLAEHQPAVWAQVARDLRAEAALGMYQLAGVVPVKGILHTEDGSDILIRQGIGGQTLASYLAQGHFLSAEQAISMGVQICAALSSLLELGLCSGTLTPDNIQLDGQTVWLTRLGPCLVSPASPMHPLPSELLDETVNASLIRAVASLMCLAHTGKAYPQRELVRQPRAFWLVIEQALGQSAQQYRRTDELQRDLSALNLQSFAGEMGILLRKPNGRRLTVLAGLLVAMVTIFGVFRVLASVNEIGDIVRQTASVPIPTSGTAYLAWATLPAAGPTVTGETPAGVADIYEPDDINPAAILPGQQQARRFWPANDIDRVSFQVRAGYGYIVQAVNVGPGVRIKIEVLLGGRSFPSAPVAAGANAAVMFHAETTGTALALVTNEGQTDQSSTYILTVQELVAEPTAAPLATPSQVLTPNGRATITPLPTYTPAGTQYGRTATLTQTPTGLYRTPTATKTPRLTYTPSRTRTATRTKTATATPTSTATTTVTPTSTPTDTPTPSLRDTVVP